MGKKGQNGKTRSTYNLIRHKKELLMYLDKLLLLAGCVETNVNKGLEQQKDINSLIDKISYIENGIEPKPVIDNRGKDDILNTFVDWARRNEAKFESCSIAEFPGYDMGLKAENDVMEGVTFLSIPRKLMLTSENAKTGVLQSLIEKDPILQHMSNVSLALFLLYEKFQENSFFKPYIDALPKKYGTILYFTIEELEELKGSPTLDMALNQIKSIARQYAYFKTIFLNADDELCKFFRTRFTYKEYRWAVSTIMTRQNTIPDSKYMSSTNALIPFWDMCNHTNGKISTNYNIETDRIECGALRDFKAGEQLFIFYGRRSNAEMFIHNAFVYENNEFDTYLIKFGVSAADPLKDKRLELLKILNIEGANEFYLNKGSESISPSLLAFLRVFNMNSEQLDHWLESDKAGDLQYKDCALDTSLEKKSWTFLQTRLKLLLAAYKTTLDEDLQLQKEAKGSANVLLTIRLRITEKLILKEALEYVEQHIKQ